MGKQFFRPESGGHQGRGTEFQCGQYVNTPFEGLRSKQKNSHNFGPRMPQDVIFCLKLSFLSLKVPLTLKNNANLCVERYFRPLPNSALKSNHFDYLNPNINFSVLTTYAL